MSRFTDAATAKDADALDAMLADDVVFRSPIVHSPYPGKAMTSAILRAVVEVFGDLTYVSETTDEAGRHGAYVFETTVDDLELTGVDLLTYDDAGQITEFMVMVRPLKAAEALARRMTERFADIEAAARAAAQPTPSA